MPNDNRPLRNTAVFAVPEPDKLRRLLLRWAFRQDYALFLDSNGHAGNWECLVAAGDAERLELSAGGAFDALQQQLDARRDWLFGFMGYDLKNEVENLHSDHADGIGLPDLGFFRPVTVAGMKNGQLIVETLDQDIASVWDAIQNTSLPAQAPPCRPVHLQARMTKPQYLETVEAIRQHIAAGDIYELNLCQEFFATDTRLDPVDLFERLNNQGKAPYSALLRWKNRWMLSASPERFLHKQGSTLVSQPIKGTRRRGTSPEEDAAIRTELAASEKDRAENVMIVDLVRNDLARNCRPGSVRVDELFGIHTFETVHQMISTVSGTLRPEIHPVKALRDAFPMGSMTGAPKVKAMDLIERYERSRRGLYSGAVGYFSPELDFDFNVVIRSLLYNGESGYVSLQAGGAIVYDSVAEMEYEECLVKASPIRKMLECR